MKRTNKRGNSKSASKASILSARQTTKKGKWRWKTVSLITGGTARVRVRDDTRLFRIVLSPQKTKLLEKQRNMNRASAVPERRKNGR